MSNTIFELTWVEINKKLLIHNLGVLRRKIGAKILLAPCVKGNAYGHGIVETAKVFEKNGADWLCVNSVWEAEILRKTGTGIPIYIMGYVLKSELELAARLKTRIVVYDKMTLDALERVAKKIKKTAIVHLKVETGTNRQGVRIKELVELAEYASRLSHIKLEGIATHFANIEHVDPRYALEAMSRPAKYSYAHFQLLEFERAMKALKNAGIHVPIRHCSNSAATLLFPQTHFEMVRPGISVYGMWPSHEVQKSAPHIKLEPALTWYSRIVQIKTIPKNAYIGYGCTYKTKRETTLAILPTGYYDGYDRALSNVGQVIVRGRRVPVRGRIFMNMTAVDITGIQGVKQEDPVILLGGEGPVRISAEEMAEKLGTINYEVTTRIRESIPRIVV